MIKFFCIMFLLISGTSTVFTGTTNMSALTTNYSIALGSHIDIFVVSMTTFDAFPMWHRWLLSVVILMTYIISISTLSLTTYVITKSKWLPRHSSQEQLTTSKSTHFDYIGHRKKLTTYVITDFMWLPGHSSQEQLTTS